MQERNVMLQTEKEFQEKLDKVAFITGWIGVIILIVYQLFSRWTNFHITKYEYPCIFHWLTGYYCPGCGGTRAVIYLFHMQFIKSFQYHPIVIVTFAIGSCFLISQFMNKITKGKIKTFHFRISFLWIALGITLINFFIKNAFLYFGMDLLK